MFWAQEYMFVIYSGTFNKYSNFISQKTMSGYHFEMRTEQFDGEKNAIINFFDEERRI